MGNNANDDLSDDIEEPKSKPSSTFIDATLNSKPQSINLVEELNSKTNGFSGNSSEIKLEVDFLSFDDNIDDFDKDIAKGSKPSYKDQVSEMLETEYSRAVSAALPVNATAHQISYDESSTSLNIAQRKMAVSRTNEHNQVGAFHIQGIGAMSSSFSEHSDHLSLEGELDSSHYKHNDHINIDESIFETGLVTAYLVEDTNSKYDDEGRKKQEEKNDKELHDLRRKGFILGVVFIVVTAIVGSILGTLLSRKNDETQMLRQYRSFKTKEELYQAVDFYINSKNPSRTIIAELYGYPIGTWDVSQLTEFDRVFDSNSRDATFSFQNINSSSTFNEDISAWNVSGATTMFGMFASAIHFNQDLSKWDVSRVTDMSHMFVQCSSFDQDLTTWDVSKVKNMSYMFYNSSFHGNISIWNTERVTDMAFMFCWDKVLGNSTRFISWNTSSVTNMTGMFRHGHSFDSPDLTGWDVSRVQSMSFMFSFADRFNSSDISGWDVGNVKNMKGMFQNTTTFNQDLSKWNVSSATMLDGAFSNATSFNNDLCDWSKLIHDGVNLTGMFLGSACESQSDPVLYAFASWCAICTY